MRFYPVLVSMILCVVVGAPSYGFGQSDFSYTLYMGDQAVGKLELKYKTETDGTYSIHQSSKIDISSFWGDIKIQGQLEEKHSQDGKLITVDNQLKDNDKTFWTKIQKSNEEFLAFKSELTNDQQKEDAETVSLMKGVIASVVPLAGDAIAVGELLFSNDQHAPKNNRFTINSFDSSFLNLPFLWKKSNYTLPSVLKVFDTEELLIITANVEDKNSVALDVHGKTLQTQFFQLKIKGTDPVDIWLNRGVNSVPYFVQIAGVADGDPYKIVLDPIPLQSRKTE